MQSIDYVKQKRSKGGERDACRQQTAVVKPQMLQRSCIAMITMWDENDHVLGQHKW